MAPEDDMQGVLLNQPYSKQATLPFFRKQSLFTYEEVYTQLFFSHAFIGFGQVSWLDVIFGMLATET